MPAGEVWFPFGKLPGSLCGNAAHLNAVVLWTTAYLNAALERLKARAIRSATKGRRASARSSASTSVHGTCPARK
jgi:hypothetical protein